MMKNKDEISQDFDAMLPEAVALVSIDEYDQADTESIERVAADRSTEMAVSDASERGHGSPPAGWNDEFTRVHRYADQAEDPGRRLRLHVDTAGIVTLSDERVFPERVDRADAVRRKTIKDLMITSEELAWVCRVGREYLKKTGGHV